jgi:hypothetical protein
MGENKRVHIIGGGTIFEVRPHLALCAPAYGATAKLLDKMTQEDRRFDTFDVYLHLTKMAGGGHQALETNQDVKKLLDTLVEDPRTKVIILNAALVDFNVTGINRPNHDSTWEAGAELPRLKSGQDYTLRLETAEKLVESIRKKRKDIFLVAFKTTSGATEQEQYLAGLNLLKGASCNLVLANDIKTRTNMIITPEEARYHVTQDRLEALKQLLDMTWHRSHLTFTQSTVVDGYKVPWDDDRVPASLRAVVDHCIKRGAYKPFRGATVGHFAVKLDDNLFLTSIRKTNFNDLDKTGLVLVKTDGPDTVLAFGAKPSVGGQSQRIVFRDHPDTDCIVHFHCPLVQRGSACPEIPVRSQREVECGSHQCGKNTSEGLKKFGNLYAVMLDEHGPNIVFNRNIDPQEVINFIEANFDLEAKTGGYVTAESPRTYGNGATHPFGAGVDVRVEVKP